MGGKILQMIPLAVFLCLSRIDSGLPRTLQTKIVSLFILVHLVTASARSSPSLETTVAFIAMTVLIQTNSVLVRGVVRKQETC